MIRDPTELLTAAANGAEDARERLTPLVYDELRRIARSHLASGAAPTLQPTALVHEAFVRLIDREVEYRSQSHFQAVAAVALRHALIDHVRGRRRDKREGDRQRVTLAGLDAAADEPELDLDRLETALRALEEVDPRAARIVVLRFFGGLTEADCARELGVSERTVRNDWRMARAWLRVRLDAGA